MLEVDTVVLPNGPLSQYVYTNTIQLHCVHTHHAYMRFTGPRAHTSCCETSHMNVDLNRLHIPSILFYSCNSHRMRERRKKEKDK